MSPRSHQQPAGRRDAVRRNVAERRGARRTEQARTPYASNWRSVLALDAGIGMVVFVAGLVLLFAVNVWVGAGIGGLGVCYVAMVVRRYHFWRELRREAGLPT